MISFALAAFIFLPLLFVLYILVRPIVNGAIYFPTKNPSVESMKRLSRAKPGERLADLGSGDGRIIIAFAKVGLETHGYEINSLLVILSKIAIRRAGLKGRAFVHWQSFWRIDLSGFDIITVYGFPRIMPRLEKKLKREVKPGTRIISNIYKFGHLKPTRNEDRIYLYVKE